MSRLPVCMLDSFSQKSYEALRRLNLRCPEWILILLLTLALLALPITPLAHAWFDETHIAVAKVAGYPKWFNACGPDMIKVKLGDREGHNHYVNNPRGTLVTPEMVMAQVGEV